jgi:UDP-glucuronate 4-epimerase
MQLNSQELYLVTGSAGFIGFHLSRQLLAQGHRVIGVDCINDYYSVKLKTDRNEILLQDRNYQFLQFDLTEKNLVFSLFKNHSFTAVFHLAAQAGVRYSLENPEAYLRSNVDATFNILEAARHHAKKTNLMLASSSSVYGLSTALPFREDDPADRPVALYGATKRSTELMAHSYSHLFSLRTTMLRFFSVYGPWGRPDVALFKFVDEMVKGKEIEVYNGGDMIRDFTYVDDIVRGLIALEIARRQEREPGYDVFNIGCSSPRTLMDFIVTIEKELGMKAKMKFLPFQGGDIYKSMADIEKITRICGWKPQVQMEAGIAEFVRWYRDYFLSA